MLDEQVLSGRFEIDPRRQARLLRLALVLACGLVAYAAAVLLDARISAIDLVFTVALAALPPLAWWAAVRAPGELRRLVALLAGAATLWLAGSVLWYGYYVAAGNRIPHPPGIWDLLFFGAYSLAFGSLWIALRPLVSLRRAALDASMILAAGIAVGATVVAHGLSGGISWVALVTLIRPLFGLATLMLVASALLGRWQGLPLSIGLIGLGQVFLTIGSFVYSVRSISGDFVADNRWADLPWFAGVCASILAALVIALRLDRPLILGVSARPGARARAGSILAASLLALAVAVGAALDAVWAHRPLVLVIDLAAAGWIGVAIGLRSFGAIRELEHAYGRLDRAHAALERANDELVVANAQLAAANVEIRSVHAAFEDVLVLLDERTDGRLRDLIEESGEDLARFLERFR